jgi:hypothetical protein
VQINNSAANVFMAMNAEQFTANCKLLFSRPGRGVLE